MYLTTEKKKEFFKKYGKSDEDTGSAEGQIALRKIRRILVHREPWLSLSVSAGVY